MEKELSAISYSYQLSAVSYQLSAIGCQFSVRFSHHQPRKVPEADS
jgi:hypothetical protein